MNTAIVVTTYNRPECLARSLPQICALGAPVLVVDDGGDALEHELEYYGMDIIQHVDRTAGSPFTVPVLRIPRNRGLCAAMNIGLSYWLADPSIEWISFFEDDVDVHPGLLRAIREAQAGLHNDCPVSPKQAAEQYPLWTGHDAYEHPTTGSNPRLGISFKKSCRGHHLHAHRDYWKSIMPIPSPYLGAPKRDNPIKPGVGADADWWVSAWAPNSVGKTGRFVACLPGYVRTFLHQAEDSTWGTECIEDPPLRD